MSKSKSNKKYAHITDPLKVTGHGKVKFAHKAEMTEPKDGEEYGKIGLAIEYEDGLKIAWLDAKNYRVHNRFGRPVAKVGAVLFGA